MAAWRQLKVYTAGVPHRGFGVIRRDADGTLPLLHRFEELGTFAANAVDLDPRAELVVEDRLPAMPPPPTP